MTNMHYLSRSFVEIGPFTTEELSSFFVRGVLKDTDYIRTESADEWIHLQDWVATLTPAAEAPAPVEAAKKAPAKKAAAKTATKKAPAKKAAKKSA